MEIVLTCPLGSVCEEIIDNKIHRCSWYVTLAGNHPQTGEPVNETKCAMAWQPILMVEGNGASKGTTIAVESLRNEHVKIQGRALEALEKHDRNSKTS